MRHALVVLLTASCGGQGKETPKPVPKAADAAVATACWPHLSLTMNVSIARSEMFAPKAGRAAVKRESADGTCARSIRA